MILSDLPSAPEMTYKTAAQSLEKTSKGIDALGGSPNDLIARLACDHKLIAFSTRDDIETTAHKPRKNFQGNRCIAWQT